MQIRNKEEDDDLHFEGGTHVAHAINDETELPEYKVGKDGIVNKSRRQ